MEKLIEELEQLTNEYIETVEKCPLLQSTKDEIMKNKIELIQEYYDKEDEFYLKKARDLLKDTIEYVKETSEKTLKLLDEIDELTKKWKTIHNIPNEEIDEVNKKSEKISENLNSGELDKMIEAKDELELLIKKYTK